MTNWVKGIIWDWNGTLLDDTKLAVETMNEMLGKRNLPTLSVDQYKEVFTFPVKDYYEKIGFDFELEPFEIPAIEFIERYNKIVSDCNLHNDAIPVLNYLQSHQIRQFIVSAMQQEMLDQCMEHYDIGKYFEYVSGLDNHYAASKVDNARRLIDELQLNPEDLILIGDTIHDFEVSSELGCKCILIANGHQSRLVLQSTGTTIVDSLMQLKDHLLNL